VGRENNRDADVLPFVLYHSIIIIIIIIIIRISLIGSAAGIQGATQKF
jgi:hypothetical protein